MAVGDATILAPGVIAPDAPQPRVRPQRDSRPGGRDGGATEQPASDFRATLEGLDATGVTSGRTGDAVDFTPRPPTPLPPARYPKTNVELSGAESADLFRAAQLRGGPANAPTAPPRDSVDARRSRSVSQHYAQSYFAVGGTFAARGEALEIYA